MTEPNRPSRPESDEEEFPPISAASGEQDFLPDRPEEPPTGDATAAGGGYGTGSDRASSGGSGDAQRPAGDDDQTDWLRDET